VWVCVVVGWRWLALVGAGWRWLALVGAGWRWLALVGAGCLVVWLVERKGASLHHHQTLFFTHSQTHTFTHTPLHTHTQTLALHTDSVWCLAATSDCGTVFSGGRDRRVFRTHLGRRETQLMARTDGPVRAMVSVGGLALLGPASEANLAHSQPLHLPPPPQKALFPKPPTPNKPSPPPPPLPQKALSPNESTLWLSSSSPSVTAYDVPTWPSELPSANLPGYTPKCAAVGEGGLGVLAEVEGGRQEALYERCSSSQASFAPPPPPPPPPSVAQLPGWQSSAAAAPVRGSVGAER